MPRKSNPEHEKLNPCLKEQAQTYKCLSDNNYDKEKCTDKMENYQYCKSFWGRVQSHRRNQGIKPYLPPVEERESVRKEFIEMFYKK